MRPVIVAVLSLPLFLAGCVSFSSSNPPPPSTTTVVVPPGTAVVCADGSALPCRSPTGQRGRRVYRLTCRTTSSANSVPEDRTGMPAERNASAVQVLQV